MKRLLGSPSNDIDVSVDLKRHCNPSSPLMITTGETTENFLSLFFRALTPYEKLRFLYIGEGVAQLLHPYHYHHIVCKVVTILARLSLYQEGFQRRYCKKDSPRLYAEVVQRYRTQCIHQVVQQAVALQLSKVPRYRIVVMCTGDDTLVLYDGFVDLMIEATRGDDIVLPPPPMLHFACMDAKQHELIRGRMGWSRRRLKQAYVALGLIGPWQARIATNLINLILQLCSDIAAALS